jgi:hypothetical protein
MDGGRCGPDARRRRGADDAMSHAERAPASQLEINLLLPTLTDSNSKTLNYSSNSPNMKVVDQITLSNFRKGRPVKFSTNLEITIFEVADLYGSVKLFRQGFD